VTPKSRPQESEGAARRADTQPPKARVAQPLQASDAVPPSLRGVSGHVPRALDKKTKKTKKPPRGADPKRQRRGDSAKPKRGKNFWRRKLRFTREGRYFLGITMGVGFAAINTGNNLLYLLLGLKLSLIIVSGVMSEISLRHLTVKRRLPARAQVGRSHLVEIEVFNEKGHVPSYAIEVEDQRAEQPADKRCFFLKISPRSAQVAAYRRLPNRRGKESHVGFRIATRFPFGLFEKSREVNSDSDLVIYPKVETVRLPNQGHGERSGDTGPLGRGHSEETFALRRMRDGEDPRDLYWRKSTVPGQFIMRERAEQTHREVRLKLDVYRAKVDSEEESEAQDKAFELRIIDLASRAVAHVKRGDRVVIKTNADERISAGRSRGIDPLLRFLALVELREASESAIPGADKDAEAAA
jgi:uncharacterized protein (DUF58 family)